VAWLVCGFLVLWLLFITAPVYNRALVLPAGLFFSGFSLERAVERFENFSFVVNNCKWRNRVGNLLYRVLTIKREHRLKRIWSNRMIFLISRSSKLLLNWWNIVFFHKIMLVQSLRFDRLLTVVRVGIQKQVGWIVKNLNIIICIYWFCFDWSIFFWLFSILFLNWIQNSIFSAASECLCWYLRLHYQAWFTSLNHWCHVPRLS
jgi:hypothetical protein